MDNGKIYKLVAKKDIWKDDFIGGDAAEYCAEHNLRHIDTPAGASIYCRACDFDWSDSPEHSFSGRGMPTIENFMKREHIKDMYKALTVLRGRCGGSYWSSDFEIVDRDFQPSV